MLEEIYPRLLTEILPSPSNELLNQRLNSSLTLKGIAETNNLYASLIKNVYLENPDSDIGLRLGQYLLPTKLCDFSRVLITAESGRDVVKLIERFYYLQGTCYHPTIHIENGVVSISLIYPYKPHSGNNQRRFCTETAFSYLVNGIRETVAPDFKPLRVVCDYASPSYARRYKDELGCEAEFDAKLSVIEFDEHILNLKLTTRNETLHQIYLHKFLDFVRNCDREKSFEYKAIAYLLLHHPDAFNSQALAKRMNISVRGLQKRLSKTGQSFSSIANDCRKELAKVYLLQKKTSLDITAEKLGFQSSSGFHRFFKSEFDTTPVQYCGDVNRLQAV